MASNAPLSLLRNARRSEAPEPRVRGAARVRVVEPLRPGIAAAWRQFWANRGYLLLFGVGFLRKRYTRTWLGWLWIPLRPGWSVGSKILIYGGLLGVATRTIPYGVLFLVATASWQLFFECAYWSTRSLELNRSVARIYHIPKLVAVVSGLIPSLLEFALYSTFAVALILYYFLRAGIVYVTFGIQLLLVPAGLALFVLLGLGIGLLTATFAASARDVRFLLQYVLAFVYFVTPVIYPMSSVPAKYRPLAEINPCTGAMELVKHGLFASEELSLKAVAVTVAAVAAAWLPGLWLSQRRETRRFAWSADAA